MTVDELTRQTLYRREDWQRVYDHAEMCGVLPVWPELARLATRGQLTPGMAHAMIDLVIAPKPTSEDFDRLNEYSHEQRNRLLADHPSLRVWPWVLLAFVLMFGGMVFFWLALR